MRSGEAIGGGFSSEIWWLSCFAFSSELDQALSEYDRLDLVRLWLDLDEDGRRCCDLIERAARGGFLIEPDCIWFCALIVR